MSMPNDGRFDREIVIWHGGNTWSEKSTPDKWRAVTVGYGKEIPENALPVFTVNTEEEAKSLIVLACPLNYDGEYFSRELVQEWNLENLEAFSNKMAYCWKAMQEQNPT